MIERGLMATGLTARSIAAGFRGLEMHDDVLNAPVAGNQCSFHLMTYAMAVADGQGWINFDVQFDEKSSSALSNEAFLDPSDPRAGLRRLCISTREAAVIPRDRWRRRRTLSRSEKRLSQ